MSWLSKPSKKQLSERDALKIEVERLKGLEQYLNEQIDEKANQSFSLFQEVAQLEAKKAHLQTEIDTMMHVAHQKAEQLAQQFIQNKKQEVDVRHYQVQQLVELVRKRNEATVEARRRRGEKRIQQGKETAYNLEWDLKRLTNNLEDDIQKALARRPRPGEPLGPLYTRKECIIRKKDQPQEFYLDPAYKHLYALAPDPYPLELEKETTKGVPVRKDHSQKAPRK